MWLYLLFSGSMWSVSEVFFCAAFFAIGGLQWLLSVLNKGGVAVQKILMIGAMVLSCIFMYSVVNVYMINSVPTWFNIYTQLSFVMIMLVGGLLLSQLVIVSAKDSCFTVDRNIVMLVVVAVAISLVVTVGKMNLVSEVQSSIVKISELVDGLGGYLSVQVAFLLAGYSFGGCR